MQLPCSPQLNIEHLGRLFDNTSECYKLFWFQAILTKLDTGRDTFTYEELVDEMITDAWYMVTEYHLNLGPKDNLEAIVKYIFEATHFKSSEKKQVIVEYLRTCDDREVLRLKKILIKNVPYRIHAPFIPEFTGAAWNVSERRLAEELNEQKRLMYYYSAFNGLGTEIKLEPDWMVYLNKNKEIIKGWIQYKMITYLQKQNPSVPGISDKLFPPRERKLTKVIKYWRLLMELQPIHEIYHNEIVTTSDLSIDHFVPWSYVAHDEFWNLHPTTKSINSSKSNHLPDWELYFPLLAEQEYFSYRMLWQYDRVRKEFHSCAKDHLNNSEVAYRLYRENQSMEAFKEQLKEVISPVYESARNSGFSNWVYTDESNDRIL